jgi:hypothetical protein
LARCDAAVIDAAPDQSALVGQTHLQRTNRATGELSMIRHTTMATTDTEVDDRSMRVVEWTMALIAAVAAGILAFIR